MGLADWPVAIFDGLIPSRPAGTREEERPRRVTPEEPCRPGSRVETILPAALPAKVLGRRRHRLQR